jgi:prohibitin 1
MKLALIISMFCLSACSVVGPGQRGVRVNLGSVSEDPKPPGAYLWLPFVMGMVKMDVQIQKSDIESTAATKDMQDVHAHVAINWSLAPENTVKTYKTIGDEDLVEQRILIPAVNEVMKAATSKRNAEEVLSKRTELKQDIDNGLKDRLAHYGITLEDVSIVNLKFSQDFSASIERKQIAEQEAKQAEYVAKKATQEAAAEIEHAKGQSEAQRLMKISMTPETLQQRAIDKWDGHFPTYMGGSLPFINLKEK